MRTISFHKAGTSAKCLYCKKNDVPAERWNRRCDECKARSVSQVGNSGVVLGSRQPAAVIETEGGQRVFVDKFGKEVKNHGYDLDKDPRGYQRNNMVNKKIII